MQKSFHVDIHADTNWQFRVSKKFDARAPKHTGLRQKKCAGRPPSAWSCVQQQGLHITPDLRVLSLPSQVFLQRNLNPSKILDSVYLQIKMF